MSWMILGLIIFLGIHSLSIFAPDWRDHQRNRLGILPWKGLYAVVAIIGLALAIWGFGQMRQNPIWVWHPPLGLQHAVSLFMLPAFVFLVAAYFPKNHIRARLGHPLLLATKLWAFSHLLVNGRLGDMVFFGAFLVWAIALFAVLRRRDRATGKMPGPTAAWATTATVILGLLFWYVFAMHLHVLVTGVPAIRMGG